MVASVGTCTCNDVPAELIASGVTASCAVLPEASRIGNTTSVLLVKLVPVSVITWPASAEGTAALAGVPSVAVALTAVSVGVGVNVAASKFTFSFSTTPWFVATSRLPDASNTMPETPILPGACGKMLTVFRIVPVLVMCTMSPV